jgi:gamma-glutamylcyclotransferase (GGCT)/AIG2-like uncharacterized protein YtfP
MTVSPQYIAFYGTLMEEQHIAIREHLKGKLLSHGKCLIPGNIYNLGRYPALKLGGERRSVHGELYEIDDPAPLALLDEYEAHDNYDSSMPGFTRRLVELDFPKQLAWVYEYDGPVSPKQLIDSENWYKTG